MGCSFDSDCDGGECVTTTGVCVSFRNELGTLDLTSLDFPDAGGVGDLPFVTELGVDLSSSD